MRCAIAKRHHSKGEKKTSDGKTRGVQLASDVTLSVHLLKGSRQMGRSDEWAADETILRACRVGAKEKCFRVAFGVLLRKHHRWNRAGKLSDYASLSIGSINKATALAVAWIALNCALRSISLYIYKRDDMKMNLNKDLSFKAVHIDDDNHDSESMSPALLLFLSFGLRLNWL